MLRIKVLGAILIFAIAIGIYSYCSNRFDRARWLSGKYEKYRTIDIGKSAASIFSKGDSLDSVVTYLGDPDASRSNCGQTTLIVDGVRIDDEAYPYLKVSDKLEVPCKTGRKTFEIYYYLYAETSEHHALIFLFDGNRKLVESSVTVTG